MRASSTCQCEYKEQAVNFIHRGNAERERPERVSVNSLVFAHVICPMQRCKFLNYGKMLMTIFLCYFFEYLAVYITAVL